jgi:hypothetical protein
MRALIQRRVRRAYQMPGQNRPAEINLLPHSRNFRFLKERFIFLAIVSKPAISQCAGQLVDFDDGLF